MVSCICETSRKWDNLFEFIGNREIEALDTNIVSMVRMGESLNMVNIKITKYINFS